MDDQRLRETQENGGWKKTVRERALSLAEDTYDRNGRNGRLKGTYS